MNTEVLKEIINEVRGQVKSNYTDKTYLYSTANGSPAADSIKERYLKVLDELETEATNGTEEDLKNYFKIKIGNKKLNDLIYNFELYMNCSTRSRCSNCLICYAKAHEPTAGVFKSRISNYIFKEYVIKTGNYDLLRETVRDINFNKLVTAYNAIARKAGKKEISINDVEYLRLSEQGAIKRTDLKYISVLIQELKTIFKDLKIYTYSHDKELKNIGVNINRSLNIKELLQEENLKENVFINYSTKEELRTIRDHTKQNKINAAVCCGDCTRCSQCKQNNKTVIICKTH